MTDPVTNPDRKTSQAPRWMKITLVISVAANLLIVGVMAGAVLTRGPQPGAPRGQAGHHGANMITQALAKDDRWALRREVRQTLRTRPDLREALHTEMAALAALMRGPDYTTDALEAQLRRIQTPMMGRLSVARGVLAARLAAFDASERAAYAARLDALLTESHR